MVSRCLSTGPPCAAFLALVSALLLPLWTAMPAPYDTVAALHVPPERVERLPASAPDFGAAFFRLADTRLLPDSVRLFEGEIHGAESVAACPYTPLSPTLSTSPSPSTSPCSYSSPTLSFPPPPPMPHAPCPSF